VELDAGPLQLFLPCIVAGRIGLLAGLLAVWTRETNSPTFRYIGQLWKYLQLHQSFLRRKEDAILIGDLNSNTRWNVWDRWWNHSDVLKRLQGLGLESLYHFNQSEPQGQELTPIFFMNRRLTKPHHIDYAFFSLNILRGASLQIDDTDGWLEHSDHMPLAVTLGH